MPLGPSGGSLVALGRRWRSLGLGGGAESEPGSQPARSGVGWAGTWVAPGAFGASGAPIARNAPAALLYGVVWRLYDI